LILANLGAASLFVTRFSHLYERSRLRNEQRLIALATTDNLTGLANRMSWPITFERELSYAEASARALNNGLLPCLPWSGVRYLHMDAHWNRGRYLPESRKVTLADACSFPAQLSGRSAFCARH
jgi:hypothetical protein